MMNTNSRINPQMPPPKPEIQYRAPGPYPPIKVECENRMYAQLLKQDCCSSKSEMTAITQYLYQGWVFKPKYPDFAKSILKIAEVEMHHLDMLGELIVLLGGNPTFAVIQNSHPVFWQGNMLRYNQPLAVVLRNNIAAEQAAVQGYQRNLTQIRDECVCAIIERIILDEQVHIQRFKELLCLLGN